MKAVAREVIEESLRRGVREFCVCPGARNSALLAALGAVSAPVSIYRFYEERSAAFFALGRMQETRLPVAVSMTSGTAVAEALPAVIEAHYQGLPLVVLSADRPARFRGSGAPQAIEQPGLFGKYAEVEIDLGGADETLEKWAAWSGRRPVHVNVCLEEPTAEEMTPPLAGDSIATKIGVFARERRVSGTGKFTRFVEEPDDLIVLVGAMEIEAAASVGAYLAGLRAPIWAEATSGLWGERTIDEFLAVMKTPKSARPDSRLWDARALEPYLLTGPETVFGHHTWKKVLRIGAVPSLRFWRDLENRPEIEVCSVTETGLSGLARDSEVVTAEPGHFFRDRTIRHALATVHHDVFAEDARAASRVRQVMAAYPRSEVGLLGLLSGEIPDGAAVFLGNSLPVREWNLCGRRSGDSRRYYANRGANGIDGALSTFLGVGAGAVEAWGIFGDLTALYDLGAPWILKQLGVLRRRFVVVNNGGGKIFSRLPALNGVSDKVKEMIETPHAIGFEAWAGMWGMEYRRIEGPGGLECGEANTVIEVVPDPAETAAFWSAMDAIDGEDE